MHVVPLVEGEDGRHGERTCLSTHPHWFWLLRQGFLGLALLALGLMLMLFSGQIHQLLWGLVPNVPTRPGAGDGADPVSGAASGIDPVLVTSFIWGPVILILLGLLVVGWALLQRHFTEYAITVSRRFGGRIIKTQGVLARQTVVVPLVMVNDLVVQEPLLGRVMGWGHVEIETGNDYQGDRLEYMPDPGRFYEMWTMLLESGYGADSPDKWPFTPGPHTEAKSRDGTIMKHDGSGRPSSPGATRRRR